MNWVHGTFTYNANGSLTMTPFGDGFQQIQNACAANSDFIESYNDTELYQSWQITTDAVLGPILQLYQFDQSPISPMTLYSASPVMLPTQSLRSVSPAAKAANRLELASGAPPSHRWQVVSITVVSALLGTVLLVLS
jgi:Chaperone for protein-folding within the ER, fungal